MAESQGIQQRLDDWLLRNSGVPLPQKVFFTENLRVMVHAGLSISEGLNTLAIQAESKSFRKIIRIVTEDVEQGRTLSQGLKKFPKVFEQVFVSMIEVGELSGTLENVLEELTDQMKKDYKLRSKVKGAMTYPIVILVAMLGITMGLLVFVLPKLLGIFKEFDTSVQLPLATRILIGISDFVQNNGILVAALLIAFALAFTAYSRTAFGRKMNHLAILRSPILGAIAKKVNLARFSRTISGLLKTDIPVVQALEITSQVVGNVHYRSAILDAGERIKKGASISSGLGAHTKLFPPLIVQMAMVGERSGNIDEMLGDIANFYEQQVDNVLDSLSSIIEPILILILGGMIGSIALAVMMPMYALTQSI